MNFSYYCLIVVLCCFSTTALSARTFTDVRGRQIEAEIVSKTEDSVTILLNGKNTTIPLKKLSKADQDFVTEWEKPAGEESPKSSVDNADIEKYFNQPWPKLVSADIGLEIEEEELDDGSFAYRSPNYEFISNAKLSKVPVKRFAVLFEATRKYVQDLPYASLKSHQTGKRYRVMLFSSSASYARAGGSIGSAGVYLSHKDLILVKFSSLGLIKRGSSWSLDYDKTNKTLPHEITHQLTDSEYFSAGARGWFSEGMAEYIAVTPYRSGKFSVNKASSAVKQYVTNFSKKDRRGRNLGTEIDAPDLKKFMTMSYREFAGENGNFNYGLGALLVTYFNHYDGEGDAASLKDFLRALKQGKKGGEALKALLAGRSFDELEEQITTAWRKRGVKIHFQ